MFEQDELCPSQELLMQFEAVSQLLPAGQAVIKDVLEGLIPKYQRRALGINAPGGSRRGGQQGGNACRTQASAAGPAHRHRGAAENATRTKAAGTTPAVEPLSIGEVAQRITVVRGQRVLLDADLASFYGETTKRLNQQATRNQARFPEDFMFRLTDEEFANLRFQSGQKARPDPATRTRDCHP